jgi:hypothetical protein
MIPAPFRFGGLNHMPYTTIALVDQEVQAHAASHDLHAAGFPSSTISVVIPERPADSSRRAAGLAAADAAALIAADSPVTVVPGSGRLRASGPILTILSGLGISANPDGMLKSLTGMGLPEEEARHVSDCLNSGDILIAVRTDEASCSDLVAEILRHHGGRDITQSAWPKAVLPPIAPA